MDQNVFDKINEQTDIVALVEEFVKLEKRGKNYFGLCPFHEEKTPSFSVSPEKNIAVCMGCRQGGAPITFYQKIKNIPFIEAASILGERVGIKLEQTPRVVDPNIKYYEMLEDASTFYQFSLFQTKSGEAVIKYLTDRKIDLEVIKKFEIGYAQSRGSLYQMLRDKGYMVSDMIDAGLVRQSKDGSYYDLFNERLMFPIKNERGRVVGFSGRALRKADNIKYVNSPDSKIFNKGNVLYNLSDSLNEIRRKGEIHLFEGFFDVIQSYQAGITTGVATMGTALTRNQAKLLANYTKNVTVIYDGDNAGITSTSKAIPILNSERLKTEVVVLPNKLDPDDFVVKFGRAKYLELVEKEKVDGYNFLYDFYKRNKNLYNVNDIEKFKQEVYRMVKPLDIVVQKYFLQKLSEDINVDLTPTLPEARQIAPKEASRKAVNKEIRAERILITQMLKSKEKALYIDQKLDIDDFAEIKCYDIRAAIVNHYKTYDDLIVEEFLLTLSEEDQSFVRKHIKTNMFYKIELAEKELEDYIKTVKGAKHRHVLEELSKQALTDPKIADKRDQMILEQMKKREEENR